MSKKHRGDFTFATCRDEYIFVWFMRVLLVEHTFVVCFAFFEFLCAQTSQGGYGFFGSSQKDLCMKETKYSMLGWVNWTENAGESLWSFGRV